MVDEVRALTTVSRDRCPSDANAVERKNKDNKEQQLCTATAKCYDKLDKASCSKHLAALDGSSIASNNTSQEKSS